MPIGIAKLGFRFNPTLMPPIRWILTPGPLGSYLEEESFSYTFKAAASASRISTYVVHAGALPEGLVLNTFSGVLQGTFDLVDETATYEFTIRATTDTGETLDGVFSIEVRKYMTEVVWITPEGELADLPLGASMGSPMEAESREVSA